ncbi:L,D-transpeptidase family protein [Rhizobium sp. PL01]|uniref:L,D-transpeptidase family protein n=1 Tax=Rhizobium sp. PL01 TaxID=3085631 RepID=UPI002980F030|nr:L,D-transpeptidase family protein [Rhizobium sp. PL01]MDW5314377.1 L,D-transpeptidase family protein [Rhizobium sp. PL01]
MTFSKALSRRQFLNMSGLAVASAGLAGCTSSMNTDRFRAETAPYFRDPSQEGRFADPRYGAALEGPVGDGMTPTGLPLQSSYYAEMYGPKIDGGFNIPAVPYEQIDARFYRQQVDNTFGEKPGTIIVDTGERFLYLILSNGSAMRYGVGIGREGFAWSGRGVLQWKQKWPRWKPPNEMVARQPHLEKYSIANGGMEPGLDNPLGARAMYIFQNGEDTLYRLHGSPEWQSIGKAVSSGCVRLINQDVIDLYDRVRDKAPILVI